MKFPQAHVHKRSQILMLRSKPFFFWPSWILFFPFLNHFLTHTCLMFTEFSSTCSCKQTSQFPASKRRMHFFYPGGSFFLQWVKLKIYFSFGLFSLREKKRGKITICGSQKSSLTHGLTSCVLDEKQKQGWFLSRKITYLPSLSIALLWFMYGHQV